MSQAADIVRSLTATRFVWVTEAELQEGIALSLEHAGHRVRREVRIDARNRLDIQVEDVAIEVKIAGTWREVQRQLARYAALPSVGALILATACPSHTRIEEAINGKPVFVHLVGSAL